MEGFYGANYTPNVVKAGASEFAGMQGDVIVTGETTHQVSRLHWNGSAFDVFGIGSFPNQPEDGIFVENLVPVLPHQLAATYGTLLDLMETMLSALLTLFRAALVSRTNLTLENLALRQQLSVYQRDKSRPKLHTSDRLFWVALRRLWPNWERALSVVRPETVISWHRQGFRLFWRRRSRARHVGRPRIPREHRAFIRRISSDHPEWGEDKIAEELAAKFGIHHAGSTIRRYMIVRRVVAEYVRYFNGARPSQAIHAIPEPYPELREPPPESGRLVALPVLGGLIPDYRLAA